MSAPNLAPVKSTSMFSIPRCTACGEPIIELVDPTHPNGPRYVAVEADPGVVGETHYRPARHRRHADHCPGSREPSPVVARRTTARISANGGGGHEAL